MSAKTPTITCYTDQTPNGVKISIALEELSLDYNVEAVDISTNTQKEQWFLDINPNGRIPALTDTITSDGKAMNVRLFESGSILLYLVDRYDPTFRISYPRGTQEYYEMINWLFFQNAGLGPMQGQANHFFRYAPEKIEYGIKRYTNETRRLYKVLDTHLEKAGTPYIVGGKCTISDISTVGWVFWAGWAGVDVEEFPTLKAWLDRMMARPAVKKGNDVPHPSKLRDILGDKDAMDEYAKHHSGWIMKAMKDDDKK